MSNTIKQPIHTDVLCVGGGVAANGRLREKLAEDAAVPAEGTGFPGITLAYNTRSREEVDAIFAMIEGIGGRIVRSPQDVFWGGYNGYFADPDGFLWEVAWNPFFEFDEKGLLKLS